MMMANEGEWVEWPGGESPLADEVAVFYRMRCGQEASLPQRAKWLDWSHADTWNDIIKVYPERKVRG